ncbi:MAG: Lrp/AsnC family transcriptional regulator, regulator for asnA, asnC and gidA [Microbacteriaceae bacterium]|jgi:Lrp/AsnC family transcriptional regulator for asnA, asnC and gidA|nr:Lrp/AsnC family transcriptional regulator [Leifsonia sp.]MDQ1579389.1 Lrp/AsnC family transcriptional regulator, regulator for asnA, asnC and gidA [Microbacteriaceae bacterium]MDQ1588124.1 Lrp/AsnC family transcriptional regulator, regulator for asnA, asnC and gidA [Microbacteriaceae bacterium]
MDTCRVTESEAEPNLDDIDRALIVALQGDGRLTYAELGELVGLSAGGARLRVLRLQEREILEVVGVTDPLKLGYHRMAMIAIEVDGDVKATADAIGALDGVIYVVFAAATFDLIVEVIAVDSESLFELINERIRRVPGVAKAQTFPYYSIHTHRFTWGTR